MAIKKVQIGSIGIDAGLSNVNVLLKKNGVEIGVPTLESLLR